MSGTWGGGRVTRLRAEVARTLPRPCARCGHPVLPTDRWDLDHLDPRSLGGATWDLAGIAPAHSSCNRRHGAQLGNAARSRRRARLGW